MQQVIMFPPALPVLLIFLYSRHQLPPFENEGPLNSPLLSFWEVNTTLTLHLQSSNEITLSILVHTPSPFPRLLFPNQHFRALLPFPPITSQTMFATGRSRMAPPLDGSDNILRAEEDAGRPWSSWLNNAGPTFVDCPIM